MVYIYGLQDPRNCHIRYIGKTKNPIKRINDHKNEVKGNSRKINWVKSLLSQKLLPIMVVIDEVDVTDWQFWEMHYISLYKSWGFDLTNHTNGGEGGVEFSKVKKVVSQETKDKISNYAKNRPRSVVEQIIATKKRLRLENPDKRSPLKGIKKSPEMLARLRMLKKEVSIETRMKLSAIMTGKKLSESHRESLRRGSVNKKNKNLRKPILQLDLEGNIVREFVSFAEAARQIFGNVKKQPSITYAVKNKTKYMGCRWILKSDIK